MAPKKKASKKNDDWESELGESAAPATEVQDAKVADAELAAPVVEEEEAPATGLMALMKKRKNKNKAVDADEDLSEKAPVEASLDDEFALPDKKGKGKAGGAKADGDDDEETGADGKVMTKAQKEKAKKEREKQRKKELAAKKKSAGPAAKAEAAPEAKAADVAAPTTTAGGKPKKLSPALAKLQKQQEEKRRREEEQARLIAEEKARIEEEERLEAEEEKRKEEAKALKKQKEREKIEQQKRDGTFLTKAQREEKLKNEMKLKQMMDAGVKIGGAGGASGDKKKGDYSKKRKTGKNPAELKAEEERVLAEAAARAQELAEKEAAEKAEAKAKLEKEAAELKAQQVESDLENWDEAPDEDSDDLKESWDADSEDEREKAAKKAAAAPKVEVPVRSKKPVDSDSDSDSDSSDDEETSARQFAEAQRKKEQAARREKAHADALAARSKDNLRSPICCILGHVDTGKTKLLDKIRQTNVQEGEAGGITQQIGATYFPVEAIKKKTQVVNKDGSFEIAVPGLLVIDTPGHESFSNLRGRGASLCNIAILVVDIMHGLEPQTLESMKLLRDRKTPFIVALNKIDRLYDWEAHPDNGFQDSLVRQKSSVQKEFERRLDETKLAFAEQSFNAELFYNNKKKGSVVSLVPTSAHTGEGIPDMLKLIIQLTQEKMVGSLMYLSEVSCTVLEVKAIEGHGMTIDVILSNGILREGDRIVVCGINGAIKTNIRALLTPAVMKELRLKSEYVHNKEVKAALGIKISAPGLEGAIAGSRLLVVGPDDDESDVEEEVEADLKTLFNRIEKSGRGVTVQASTLGSLEALLDFLKVSKIPVANVGIGPVFKRDVMQAGTMLEKSPEYALMLCFDVKIDKEAQAYADSEGILIFTAEIIYHLFDQFTKHMAQIAAKKKEESKLLAIFPAVLRPVAIFNKTGPIVIGVDVIEGNLKLLTPVCAVKTNSVTGVKEIVSIGRVSSIERDHKQLQICKKGEPSVAIKIEMGGHQPTYGRHLEESDVLYSMISRKSIDCLKDHYRDEMKTDDWNLIKKLKPLFDIP